MFSLVVFFPIFFFSFFFSLFLGAVGDGGDVVWVEPHTSKLCFYAKVIYTLDVCIQGQLPRKNRGAKMQACLLKREKNPFKSQTLCIYVLLFDFQCFTSVY